MIFRCSFPHTSRADPNPVTSPTRAPPASEINCYWKLFYLPLPSTFLRSLCNLVPGRNKNCRTDHKLRLASRRRFCYNRERWNINIVSANTKCKTVWLRTVSGNISYSRGVCSARMLHLHLKSLNSCIFSLFLFTSSAIRRMQRVGA